MLDIGKGELRRMSPADGLARFQHYFERAEFTRYEDLVPPIVRISADGTLGWLIAQVRVEGTYRDDDGVRTPLDTTWAWVELYERIGDNWRMTAIASTRTPDPPCPPPLAR